MKKRLDLRKYISCFFISVLLVSQTAYAKNVDNTVGAMNSTVYTNLSTAQIVSEYKENAFRAASKYKDYDIGIIGEILSISSTGEQIYMKSESSDMSFLCDCADKTLKNTVESVSAGDEVIVCGKVKKPGEKVFEVKANRIIPIKTDMEKYENGYTTSAGTIFLNGETKDYSISGNTCVIQSKWEEQKSEEFWEKYIEDEFVNKRGMTVQLGDETDSELLGIYSFSWDELKDKATKNRAKKLYEFEKEYVEECLINKLIKKNMNYKLGIANTAKTKKTDNVTFDYYHGTKEEAGKTVHSELFFVRSGDKLTAITYLYRDKPQYAPQVNLLLGSFKLNAT